MANYFCDIGSFFIGFFAGSLTGKYGRRIYKLLVNYTEPSNIYDWDEKCARINEEEYEPDVECECQCGKQQ